MNGFRGDDDLKYVNDRIHALHVDAARQRVVRRADVAASAPSHRAVAVAVDWTLRVLHGRPAPVAGR